MQQMVSDETWSRLDPYQGALTGRQRLRAAAVVVAAVLLVALGFEVWSTGLLRPRLAFADRYSRSDSDSNQHTFTLTLHLLNEGSTSAHLTGIGRSGAGLRLVNVTGAPVTLKPSEETEVSLTYQVTDCTAAQQGDWPIPVTAERPGPDPTVGVLPSSRTPVTADGFDEVPWQEAMVTDACSKPGTHLSGVSS